MADVRSDPITLQLIAQRLAAIPEMVEQNITKTAFSPLVADYKDYAAGLVDAEGRLITQTRGGLPIFVANALGTAVRHGCEVHGAENLRHGDVLISNDPGTLGQHLNNTVMYTPIRVDGADGRDHLFGFFAVLVHYLDVGGSVIGSIAPHSSDIWMEGTQYPSVRLYREGEPVRDVYAMLEANTRFPKELMGDVAAQLGGCVFGRDRVSEIIGQYGVADVEESIRKRWAQSSAHTRRVISALPDGVYRSAGRFDDDGVHLGEPVELIATVTIAGEKMTVDFTGTAPQVPSAHNAGVNGGAVAAARMALKYLISTHESADEGVFENLEVIAPPGTFLSARPEAAIGCSGNILPLAVDLILRALGEAGAEVVPAAHHGSYNWYIFGGRNDNGFWQSMSSMPGGWGAGHGRDGAGPFRSVCHGDTLEVPVELQEALFPMRFEEMSLRPDSGGAGQYRGGPGVTLSVTLLADATMSSSIDRTGCPPWGLNGGGDGEPAGGEITVDGVTTSFARISGTPVPTGATVTVRSAGGGGFGPACQRDPERVAEDVRQGLVSEAAAEEAFGVVVRPDPGGRPADAAGSRESGGSETGGDEDAAV